LVLGKLIASRNREAVKVFQLIVHTKLFPFVFFLEGEACSFGVNVNNEENEYLN